MECKLNTYQILAGTHHAWIEASCLHPTQSGAVEIRKGSEIVGVITDGIIIIKQNKPEQDC